MTIDLVNYKIVVEFEILVHRVLNHGQQDNSLEMESCDDLDHVGFWILVNVKRKGLKIAVAIGNYELKEKMMVNVLVVSILVGGGGAAFKNIKFFGGADCVNWLP